MGEGGRGGGEGIEDEGGGGYGACLGLENSFFPFNRLLRMGWSRVGDEVEWFRRGASVRLNYDTG